MLTLGRERMEGQSYTGSSCASQAALLVENLPAVQETQETQVRFPGREGPLQWQPTPVFLPGSPTDRGAWQLQSTGSHGVGHG